MSDYMRQLAAVADATANPKDVSSTFGLIEAIDDILDQTNLLALGVAVENTRYGGVCPGLLTISEDTKNLADRARLVMADVKAASALSSDKSKDIQDAIIGIIDIARSTLAAIRQAAEPLSEQSRTSGHIDDRRESIEKLLSACKV